MLQALLLALQLAAIPPMPPASLAETPAMREAASLASSTSAAPKSLLTRAEATGFRETGSYAETLAFYRALEKSSPSAPPARAGRSTSSSSPRTAPSPRWRRAAPPSPSSCSRTASTPARTAARMPP